MPKSMCSIVSRIVRRFEGLLSNDRVIMLVGQNDVVNLIKDTVVFCMVRSQIFGVYEEKKISENSTL